MDSSIVAQISAPSSLQRFFVSSDRSLVCGIGIYDALHPTRVNGRDIKTYQTWHGMLERCYSAKCQARQPSYVGCTVDVSWLHFSVFEKWMLSQNYEGRALDKDLLFPGNKVYSAETCVFVPLALNSLLVTAKATRGEYPLGVSYCKGRGKWQANVSVNGVKTSLGRHSTPLEAHRAWQLAKADIIEAFPTEDIRVRLALDKRATKLRENAANGRITETL